MKGLELPNPNETNEIRGKNEGNCNASMFRMQEKKLYDHKKQKEKYDKNRAQEILPF